MKIILIISVFCVVFQTKASPMSSEDNGELNESNIRLRRAYNYERHSSDYTNYDVKSTFLVFKLSTTIRSLKSTTVPMKTSTANQDRAYKEDSIRTIKEDNVTSTTEQQTRNTTVEQLRAFSEVVTEGNSSREQNTK